ncbi:lipopolysaccharide biosynthesis protein [Lutibacter sp. Hel_I_33_5]|uniref:lipopolysaccharide biosynthesis protein n=1 Tax=Lutibacter sp. Hel_I_33_5 TaxID=1566289 RepID=UPI0016456FE6|nr:oligosaccharide flippase family protein [Lutibacter sp. Hel_I_33_5]
MGLAIMFVSTAIITRSLGPKAYGDFSFLNNFFIQLIPFFTFSTSIAFFTKLSQRNNEFGLVRFFRIISIIAFILLFLIIVFSQTFKLNNFLWPEQSIYLVYLAAIFAILTWIVSSLTQISDALGITVSTEIAKIIQRIIGLFLISFLYYLHLIDIFNFYYYNYFILLLLIIAFVYLINRPDFNFTSGWCMGKKEFKKYYNEFYIYSKPLFFYSLIGLIVGLFDRWLLQKFGGSIQQGFFELSLKIGAVCFIFTNASSQLITREFSIAFGENDLKEMKRLFRRYIPLLFSIASFLSCFIAVNASTVTNIFGGSQFASATVPIAIMAFYPIHQTYGQLSGAVFYASGDTKLYSKIGLIFMFVGLPISYFVIAPVNFLGLNAGAIGLAIKFVVLQFIAVNVQLYFNSKLLKLNFIKYLFHQLVIITYLILLSLLSKILLIKLISYEVDGIIGFLCSGVVYSTMVAMSVYFFPILFGLNKTDIFNGVNCIKAYIYSFKKKNKKQV